MMESEPHRALIVGSNGYLGKELFAAAGRVGEVRGTSSRPATGTLRLALGDAAAFDYATLRRGEVVFLTAALSEPDVCARERERAWAVNVDGTSTFIGKALDRGARVMFFSSDTVYGEQRAPCDETVAPVAGGGAYADMKRAVEANFDGHPEFKAIRLSYVFSSSDRFSRYLAGCATRDAVAEVFDPFSRAVIHRDDVIAGALALARDWAAFPAAAINFGGPQLLSRLEFAQTLKDTMLPGLRFAATPPPPDFFANRPRVVAMQSPLLPRLLGRPQRALREAAILESKGALAL